MTPHPSSPRTFWEWLPSGSSSSPTRSHVKTLQQQDTLRIHAFPFPENPPSKPRELQQLSPSSSRRFPAPGSSGVGLTPFPPFPQAQSTGAPLKKSPQGGPAAPQSGQSSPGKRVPSSESTGLHPRGVGAFPGQPTAGSGQFLPARVPTDTERGDPPTPQHQTQQRTKPETPQKKRKKINKNKHPPRLRGLRHH